jgi:aclacinomycin oxidase
VERYVAALSEAIRTPNGPQVTRMSWLDFALNPFPDLFAAPPGGVNVKVKDALLKRRLTDNQIGIAYDYLTSSDHDVGGGMLGLQAMAGTSTRSRPLRLRRRSATRFSTWRARRAGWIRKTN